MPLISFSQETIREFSHAFLLLEAAYEIVHQVVTDLESQGDCPSDELVSLKDLVAAYEQVEGAFLDALHALNDAALPCPASLGLAMEKLRQIIAKAKATA